MNYTELLQGLNKASPFDLYRLVSAIESQLDEPKRIEQIRRHLRAGQDITYFEPKDNRLVEARVLALNRARVHVRNKDDGREWSIRYCAVNVGNVDTDLHGPSRKSLERLSVRVGDSVGFTTREGRDVGGRVIKLNQKTATIETERGKWRVSYSLLYRIVEVETIPTEGLTHGPTGSG